MYRCLNCGAEFEEPCEEHVYDETQNYFVEQKYCPECCTDDIEKLHLCRCEREYITDSQDRCPQCEKEIDKAMKEARERIKNGCGVDHQQATEDIVWWVEREG